MYCTIENAGPYVRVYLRGKMLSRSAAMIYDELVGLALAANKRVLVDLKGVTTSSPAGCRALLVAARLLHIKGGKLAICGAGPVLLETLQACCATHAFRCFDDEAGASDYLNGRDTLHPCIAAAA